MIAETDRETRYENLAQFLRHPLLAPLAALELPLGASWPSVMELNEWARANPAFAAAAPELCFVSELRPGARRRRREKKLAPASVRSYEARVVEERKIATRPEHPHDFFNALIWLTYPQSKLELHQRAYALQRGNTSRLRLPEADVLTCFDEGGLVYLCSPEEDPVAVSELLLSRRDGEKEFFCRERRQNFRVFGHGILEGLWLEERAELMLLTVVLAPPPSLHKLSLDPHLAAFIREIELSTVALGTVPFAALWKL